jgi:hypothetical protein
MIANMFLKPAVTQDKSPWLAAILSVTEAPSMLSSRHNTTTLRGSFVFDAKKQNAPVRPNGFAFVHPVASLINT